VPSRATTSIGVFWLLTVRVGFVGLRLTVGGLRWAFEGVVVGFSFDPGLSLLFSSRRWYFFL